MTIKELLEIVLSVGNGRNSAVVERNQPSNIMQNNLKETRVRENT